MNIKTVYMKQFKILLLISLLTVNELKPQALSLDSILTIVEKNNPEFRIYEERINAYKEYANGARSLDAPQVGAGFFMTPYNVSMWGSDEMSGTPGMGNFMISAQQMITNRKKLNANYNYMNSMAAVDSTMKNAMRNEMFMMVKMNYFDWMIMNKKLVVLKESEDVMLYLVKATELKYTYGMEKLNAYYKAKAMLGDIQNMRLMMEQEIKQRMISLNYFMNRDKTTEFSIDTLYQVKYYEKEKPDSLIIAKTRSDYKTLSGEINVLKSKQNYENSKKYPDYGIRYDHMFPFGTAPQQFSLMFMVSIPIVPWSSKMYSANVKGLEFEMESIKASQSALLNTISGKIEMIKANIYSKKQQIELSENVIIPAMRKNYETELVAYEQNTEMLFMVLDAWQNLKLAQLTYLDQLMELLLLQVQYEKELEIR